MNTTITRKKKKEAIPTAEFKAFSKWVSQQMTKTDAAAEVGVTFVTLDKVLTKRTASPETIAKIRKVISNANA